MSAFDKLSVKAGGTIEPMRFVRYSAEWTVIQASDNDHEDVVGVSGEDAKYAPTPGAETAHAETGDEVLVHRPGRLARVTASAAFSAGALLTADADGKGVAATTGQNVYARAIEAAGAEDETPLCEILPVPMLKG